MYMEISMNSFPIKWHNAVWMESKLVKFAFIPFFPNPENVVPIKRRLHFLPLLRFLLCQLNHPLSLQVHELLRCYFNDNTKKHHTAFCMVPFVMIRL